MLGNSIRNAKCWIMMLNSSNGIVVICLPKALPKAKMKLCDRRNTIRLMNFWNSSLICFHECKQYIRRIHALDLCELLKFLILIHPAINCHELSSRNNCIDQHLWRISNWEMCRTNSKGSIKIIYWFIRREKMWVKRISIPSPLYGQSSVENQSAEFIEHSLHSKHSFQMSRTKFVNY